MGHLRPPLTYRRCYRRCYKRCYKRCSVTADYLQEVLSEASTKKKIRKSVTLLANEKGGMRNYLLEVISTATYVKEVKKTCYASRKVSNGCSKRCSKRCYKMCYMRQEVLKEVLQEVLDEVFNGRKWPTTYLQKVLREVRAHTPLRIYPLFRRSDRTARSIWLGYAYVCCNAKIDALWYGGAVGIRYVGKCRRRQSRRRAIDLLHG